MTRLVALGLAAALAGCGVKGPPRPPERPAATPVRAAPTAAAGADADRACETCEGCAAERPVPAGAEGR